MADTTFVDNSTVIVADWLNDVNDNVYTSFPALETTVTGLGNTKADKVSPTLTTPNIGVATATSVNKITITAPATGATLTIPDGQTATISGTSSGTNTGDQSVFRTIAVSGQSDVVADSTTDTLTLVAGAGMTITTNAGTDTITLAAPGVTGLTFLAEITPTAAANVDFLTTFSASYDNYRVVGVGITPSAADQLRVRAAVAGAADSGSNYVAAPNGSTNATTATSIVAIIDVLNTGRGGNFVMDVLNANSTTKLKSIASLSLSESATNTYRMDQNQGVHTPANVITGLRFFWSGGANFAAAGKIHVYGYNNT